LYDFWPIVLGLFAAGGIPVWFLMRRKHIGTRRADWGLSAVLFGWFFASVGVAGELLAGYILYEVTLGTDCSNPNNTWGCALGASFFLGLLVASLIPLGIGAFILRFAPRR
jgi:hypothetical protein